MDPKQAKKASTLIETELSPIEPGYITLATLVEITWVLESCFDQSKEDVFSVLHGLLTTKQLIAESASLAYLAIRRCTTASYDFSDALIAVISEQAGCSRVVTFDKKARSVGMELL